VYDHNPPTLRTDSGHSHSNTASHTYVLRAVQTKHGQNYSKRVMSDSDQHSAKAALKSARNEDRTIVIRSGCSASSISG